MESLDLTLKALIALKIKSKTLDRIYFMSQVFQEHSHCYDKREKKENENYENLSIFAATPSLSGRGGGCCNPTPQLFSPQKFDFFFIDTWVSGQRVGKLTIYQS